MNFKLSTSVIIGIGLSRMCRGLPVDAYSIREELGFANPAQLGKVWEEFLAESRIKSIQHELQFLQNLDYSNIELSEVAADAISLVCEKAKSIYGEGWNYYSNALRMEVAKGFDLAIERLSNRKTNYLEIGSCQGLSMGLIGTILKKKSLISSLVSIDPYFENGYIEGKHGPWREDLNIRVDKSTKIQAETLYRNLQLPVRIIEKKSHGIYHTAGASHLNRYEIALKCAEIFNYDKNLITPIESLKQEAQRPKNAGLDLTKLRNVLQNELEIFDLEKGLINMKRNILLSWVNIRRR